MNIPFLQSTLATIIAERELDFFPENNNKVLENSGKGSK